MAITLKDITELPTGTPVSTSPIIFGQGTNLFTFTFGQLLSIVQGDFVTDLSFVTVSSLVTSEVIIVGNNPSLNFNLTIPRGQVTFIKLQVISEQNIYSENTYLIPLGEGTYNPLSNTIAFEDLILIEKKALGTAPSGANTVTYTVADLATLNASDPALDFSNSNLIYFVVLGGILYRFVGTNGLYGLGELQMTMADLQQVSELTPQPQPTTGTPPVSGTFSINLSNFFGVDYSGSTTALTSIDIALGAVLGGNARVKGNWPTKPTVTGATEAENSFFIANQVVYLYFESWSDGIIYWFSEN